MQRAASLLITVSFALVACSDAPTRTEISSPFFEIVDAVHNSGNEHFFFLPPMVSDPVTSGTFDASLEPVVEICELALCGTSTIATFTTTTGPGSETVRLSTVDEHYVVNWHTDLSNLDPAMTYRIRVSVDDVELGYADVDVVNSGKGLKDVNTDLYIPLKDGRTLPIKFRIEDGALITGTRWATVGLGFEFSCGITTDGDGYCWGSSGFGQGGTGFANRLNHFIQPITGGRTLTTIDPGTEENCALATDGTAWCSGSNASGVLGTTVPTPPVCAGGRPCVHDPLMVENAPPFAELHIKGTHGCGLTSGGTAYCWGTFQAQLLGTGSDGTFGPCQVGPANCSPTPIPVGGGLNFTTMTIGAASCGLTATGDPLGNVWCWGENKWGPVGNGTNNNRYFVPVRGADGMEFASIDGGGNNTCALKSDGDAYCWGFNKLGALGIGDDTQPTDCNPTTGFTACAKTPVAVSGGLKFIKISVAEEFEGFHVCAISVNADVYCWGHNDKGQVGDGATTNQYNAPNLVAGGHKFIDIETGGSHTCGVTVDREIYCWGNNSAGQLGAGLLPGDPDTTLGDANPHPEPVKVLDPA